MEQEQQHRQSRTAQAVGQLWSAEGKKASVGCLDPREARSTTSSGLYGVEILTPLVLTLGTG